MVFVATEFWFVLKQGLFVVIMACIQHSRNALRRLIAKETSLKSSDGAIHPLLYACQGVRYKKLEVILTTVSRKYFIFGFLIRLCVGSDIDVDSGF